MTDVGSAAASGLAEPLALLERWLRDGEPVSEAFAGGLRREVEAGRLEVLVARAGVRVVGVAVLAFRLNVAAAGTFASVEDLYVIPEARGRGVGRSLLEAVRERCRARGVSYVETQAAGEEAVALYRALGYEPEVGVRVLSRSYPLEIGPG